MRSPTQPPAGWSNRPRTYAVRNLNKPIHHSKRGTRLGRRRQGQLGL